MVIFQAHIHPFDILLAMENYKRCQSSGGKTRWEPSSPILEAMESAYYKSLQVGSLVTHCAVLGPSRTE